MTEETVPIPRRRDEEMQTKEDDVEGNAGHFHVARRKSSARDPIRSSAHTVFAFDNDEVEPARPARRPSRRFSTPVRELSIKPLMGEENLSYENIRSSVPFEEMYNSEQRRQDPLQEMVTFPTDNLVFSTFSKTRRSDATSSHILEAKEQSLDPYVHVCFECFSSDWILISTKHHGYSLWRPPCSVYDLGAPTYAGDDDQEKKKAEMPDLAQYLRPWNRRTDERNRRNRAKGRLRIFQYYDPQYDWQPGTEVAICKRIRKTAPPDLKPHEQVKFRPFHFVVRPRSLVFQIGELEPFFCTLTLYQMNQNKEVFQISEQFHFHLNSPNLLEMLNYHWNPPLSEKKVDCGALFSVTRRSAKVFLVLEICKVLQGNPEVAVDPYSKVSLAVTSKTQEKITGKIKYETEDYCSRLGQYRQAFGWSILQVFDAKGNLLLDENTRFESIYAYGSRDSIPNLVEAFALNDPARDSFRKMKNLNGFCHVVVSKLSQDDFESVRLLDSSLEERHTDRSPTEGPFLRDIHEFLQVPSFVPNFSYINNMYVYPLYANLSSRSGRNIAIRMQVKDSDDDIASPGLRCITHPYEAALVDEVYSTVQYHSKTPTFSSEEFKLILPPTLTAKHHLLFTFFHIGVAKKKKVEELETALCYAVVPLYPRGRIVVHNNGDHYGAQLFNKLEPGYLSEIPETADTKPHFTLRFTLVSTIFPEDKSITEFLNIYHTTEEEVPDKKLISVLKQLQDLTELLAIQYLPVIINNLLEVMVARESNMVQFEAFRALVMVLHKVRTKLEEKDVPRTSLLELYTNYIFQQTFNTQHAVYEALCSNFLLYMMDKKGQTPEEQSRDSIFINSWFIFDLVIKSMALELHRKDQLNIADRKELFSDIFVRTLTRLIVNLSKFFKDQMAISGSYKNPEIRMLNRNLALFVSDLFAVFDRGIVIDIIRTYLLEMMHPEEELASTSYKMEFLTIIADHEHFVPLNLPFRLDSDFSVLALGNRHPLANTIILNVLHALQSSNHRVWDLGITTLYNIVVKNAFDNRYAPEAHRHRIAEIYFILIPMFLEEWDSYEQWREEVSIQSKREFYICILFILDSCNASMLHRWWVHELPDIHSLFFDMCRDIACAFEYSPELQRPTKSILTPEVALFINKAGTNEMNDVLLSVSDQQITPEKEDLRLRWLTSEVQMLLLDVLELFLQDFVQELSGITSVNPVFASIVEFLCTLMSMRSSLRFIHALYASLRSFAHKFAHVLFQAQNTYLALILQYVILHCNFPEPDVHVEASSFLFILLKLNQKTVGNFGRTKTQAVTTLSNLVQNKHITSDVALQKSFESLSTYALSAYATLEIQDIDGRSDLRYDMDAAHSIFSSFAHSVQEMAVSLPNILRDTLRVLQMAETADSHELADLYYQIAEGYRNTPDLRLTWLHRLTNLQQQKENFVESAVASSCGGALIADYLIQSGQIAPDLIDTRIFSSLLPFIKETSTSSEETICLSGLFTTKALIQYIRNAIRCFKEAEYFEFAAKLYNLILPIYELEENYNHLSQAHTQMQEFWSHVSQTNEGRLFGRYFRVGFFGTPFKDLNGREYVYKEPKLTHILELTESLKALFEKQTGQEVNHLDAGKDLTTISPDQCFLQITKIDPYLEDTTLPRRTFFQRNVNISEFKFETPFTLTGKSHADSISDQYKRKTILTVAGSFPYLLTRLPVVAKRDIIISPIENAIEDINMRNVSLKQEVDRQPVNHKTLTQLLQGSALPQVNEGALSFCRIFLGESYGQHPPESVQELCNSLKQFLSLIRTGLNLNKQLINTEHDKEFHYEMEGGFRQLEHEILKHIQESTSHLTVPKDPQGMTRAHSDEDLDSSAMSPSLRVRTRANTVFRSDSHSPSSSPMTSGEFLPTVIEPASSTSTLDDVKTTPTRHGHTRTKSLKGRSSGSHLHKRTDSIKSSDPKPSTPAHSAAPAADSPQEETQESSSTKIRRMPSAPEDSFVMKRPKQQVHKKPTMD